MVSVVVVGAIDYYLHYKPGPLSIKSVMHLSVYCPTYPSTGKRWGFDLICPINMPQIRPVLFGNVFLVTRPHTI